MVSADNLAHRAGSARLIHARLAVITRTRLRGARTLSLNIRSFRPAWSFGKNMCPQTVRSFAVVFKRTVSLSSQPSICDRQLSITGIQSTNLENAKGKAKISLSLVLPPNARQHS